MQPRHPIYIISKGRHESRLTAKALDRMRVPFRMVVEEPELDAYSAVIGRERLIVLDEAYKEAYDACDEFGLSRSKGSGPARNFVWDHSATEGREFHWILDDNIRGFVRAHENERIPLGDGTAFRCMEEFAERYENLALSGPHYWTFRPRFSKWPVATMNTRVFSCILIRNDLPLRWRARYNEDLDLSLRVLKAGWCTIQYNCFLQIKVVTQSMTGGNTDELYKDGTLEKSRMIQRLHPDVARVAMRYGRVHHSVDYRPFKRNKLRLREGVEVPDGVDDHGMLLRRLT